MSRVDLRPFAATSHAKPGIPRAPFRWGGFTWATDGVIIVRGPSDAECIIDAGFGPLCQARLDASFQWSRGCEYRIEWEHPAQTDAPCECCGGTPQPCPECLETCVVCNGSGVTLQPEVFGWLDVGGFKLDVRQWMRLRALTGILFGRPLPVTRNFHDARALPFRADGGVRGVVAECLSEREPLASAVFIGGDVHGGAE